MPMIFVSHAAIDAEIANEFKKDVEEKFLGLCKVFISSNLDSVSAGVEWIKEIKSALQSCSIFIGLLSPSALTRPWVYFEFGAVWLRDGVPTIPVCHTGLRVEQLPVPLSTFQALNLSDPLHLRHLFEKIAASIVCRSPDVNFDELAGKYRYITERKRELRVMKELIENLKNWNPEFMKFLESDLHQIQVHIPPSFDQTMLFMAKIASDIDFISIKQNGVALGTPIGAHASLYLIQKGGRFAESLATLAGVEI